MVLSNCVACISTICDKVFSGQHRSGIPFSEDVSATALQMGPSVFETGDDMKCEDNITPEVQFLTAGVANTADMTVCCELVTNKTFLSLQPEKKAMRRVSSAPLIQANPLQSFDEWSAESDAPQRYAPLLILGRQTILGHRCPLLVRLATLMRARGPANSCASALVAIEASIVSSAISASGDRRAGAQSVGRS